MGLTRKMLKELGLEADAIDSIMEAHGASMSNMVTKAEEDDAIKVAIAGAKAEWEKANPKPAPITESAEYKELMSKYKGLELDYKLNEIKVKAKYRDIVKSKLNPEDFDKSISTIKTDFAEFFEEDKAPEPPKKTPAFADNGKREPEKSEEERIKEEFAKAFS